jgi:hypothetical protein
VTSLRAQSIEEALSQVELEERQSMTKLTIPLFGELLAPFLTPIPAEAKPGSLAILERGAAERYRGWADAVPEYRDGLMACAAREDQIADRIDALIPIPREHQGTVDDLIMPAKQAYFGVFENLSVIDQMTIQAAAERQGAQAWPGFIPAYPHIAEELRALSAIELISADYLDDILNEMSK